MINLQVIVALLLLAPPVLADDNADAVNERIPFSKAELETHWQVDCAAVRDRFLAVAAQPVASGRCGITAGLQRKIQLCGFIYQPPGGSSRPGCPDYGGVSKQLNRIGQLSECNNLLSSVRQLLDCGSTNTRQRK